MQEWHARLRALYAHEVLIARPSVDFSYLCANDYAERTFFRDDGDGVMMAYQITDAGRALARRIKWGTLS